MTLKSEKIDILSMKTFEKESIIQILSLANSFEKNNSSYSHLLTGKIIATMFLEPSTRTRLSFVSAAIRLGAQVLSYESSTGTSQLKGESLYDTIKMMDYYADLIVIRHPNDGTARFVAETSNLPVINAGDGTNEHPTQTFLDLYTIYKNRGTLENLKIGFVGDLKYGRTVHSLSLALSHFNSEMFFISPEMLKMPEYLTQNLKNSNIVLTESTDYKEIINTLDVLYVTRIQKERFTDAMDYEKVKGVYTITAYDLKNVKPSLMIMHPLPRVDEIALDVDDTPHAFYFEQALNGVYVREALLSLCLGKVPTGSSFKIKNKLNSQKSFIEEQYTCGNPKCISHIEKKADTPFYYNNNLESFICYYCGRTFDKNERGSLP